jgi:hypothetical protein
MLNVALRIELKAAAELVLALSKSRKDKMVAPAGIDSTPMSDAISDALLRLLTALSCRTMPPFWGWRS